MRILLTMLFAAVLGSGAMADAGDRTPHTACENRIGADERLLICRFDPREHRIRLFLQDGDGNYYRHFTSLQRSLTARGDTLRFAMNAGMYHADRSPVGLFVEDGATLKSANTKDGPGNFHLKPNGIFYIAADGRAGVQETGAFLKSKRKVRFATQSGPMLVIEGKIHPRFIPDSPSKKRRNGVGVTRDGQVIFVLSDSLVSFDSFARLFRDELKTPNALYLDGTISRIHAPALGRSDAGFAMGPIVGVVEADKTAETGNSPAE